MVRSTGARRYSVIASSLSLGVERFSSVYASVEDLDGDGLLEFVVGCENRESFAPGRMFVSSGKSSRLLALLGRMADGIEGLPLTRK